MKPEGFLSLKDYFNYYISGLLWFLSFLFLGLFFSGISISDFLNSILTTKVETGGAIVLGSLFIFIPYIVGFVMSPSSEWIRKLWQGGKERTRFPDPRKYLLQVQKKNSTNTEEKKTGAKSIAVEIQDKEQSQKFSGRRLSIKETSEITKRAKQNFGAEYSTAVHLYFYPIRAFVIEYGTASATLADRARDLANFTESLLLPAPLTLMALFLLLFWGTWFYLTFGIVITIALHLALRNRYFVLEEYWVKHVYRAFLVITSKKES